MYQNFKNNLLIFLKHVLDYYYDDNKINDYPIEDVNIDDTVFMTCPKCYNIYTLKYFLTDICVFCLDDKIRKNQTLSKL